MAQIQSGLFMVATLPLFTAVLCLGQTGCLNGALFTGLGVNGSIRLCPEHGAQVPGLQEQLAQLQRTVSGNEELLRAMRHTAHSVNSVAQNINAGRQTLLLLTLSHDLQQWVATGKAETADQMAELAGKLDALQGSIKEDKEDSRTAQKTLIALSGTLGGAIAKLDLAGAQKQLDSIQGALSIIAQNSEQMRRTVEDQAAREKASDTPDSLRLSAYDMQRRLQNFRGAWADAALAVREDAVNGNISISAVDPYDSAVDRRYAAMYEKQLEPQLSNLKLQLLQAVPGLTSYHDYYKVGTIMHAVTRR